MTSADASELVLQLERKATGAISHTCGKAKFYINALIDKPNARFSNCTQEAFLTAVRAAVYRGEWKELSNIMAGWW